MAERDQSLLFWLNDFSPEEPNNITSICDVFGSNKMKCALKKLLPPELMPVDSDSIVYVYTVLLAMLKKHGIGNTFKNALKQSNEENNEIVLFFLYALFRQINQNAKIKEEYTKAESMYQKWLKQNISDSQQEFNFDSLKQQLESSNREKQQEIEDLERELDDQKKELQKIVDDVKVSFDNLLDKASQKAAEEERKREKLINENKQMDAQIISLQEKLRATEEENQKIAQIEKENENLSNEIEESKKEKNDLEEKEKQIALSGMTIQNLDEEIQRLKEEIESLAIQYEYLSNKKINDEKIIESEIAEQKRILEQLKIKVEETNPEIVLKQWEEEISKEINKAEEEAKRIQELIGLGESLM